MIPPDAKLLRLDTSPVEPLSLAEAKLYLRVEVADDDALIGSLVTAARVKCEQVADATLSAASYTLTCDYLPYGGILPYLNFWAAPWSSWSAGVIDLPAPPLVAVQAIRYVGLDGLPHTLDPASYRVSPGTPGQIQPAYGTVWPFQIPEVGSVQVDFTAGLDPTKLDCVKAAVRLIVAHYYTHRSAAVPIDETTIGFILGPARNYGYG